MNPPDKIFPHYRHEWNDGICKICQVKQCEEIVKDIASGETRRCRNKVAITEGAKLCNYHNKVRLGIL